jgi:hypothetical protein
VKAEDVIPRMRELEHYGDHPNPRISVESVICLLLGLEEEGITDVLIQERERVADLWRDRYSRVGVKFTAETAISLGFLQGVTFAAAAMKLHEESE